jgi:hypothetical protein
MDEYAPRDDADGSGNPFAESYAQARRRFLHAATAAGAGIVSHAHPLRGREAEELAVDVALDGDPEAANLLLVTSGCHGVEGYAGSGVQVATLRDRLLRARAREAGVTLLHVHALNPHGYSHLRRTTHENVDLNRNFRDFSQPLPANPAYAALHPLLVPEQWPPTPGTQAALMQAAAAHGMKSFQSAISGGQHEFPGGLFFGGSEPCWSNLTLRRILQEHAGRAKRIGWIDLHTGLGPPGVGERILACAAPDAIARARAWWGAAVTSVEDDTSVSATVSGPMWTVVPDECPQAEYTGIALEYGTVPVLQVLQALRADAWLFAHPDAPRELTAQVGRQMLDAFRIDSDEWRAGVLAQARDAIQQAIGGLAAGSLRGESSRPAPPRRPGRAAAP